MKEDKLKDFVNRQRQEFESHEGDYEIMWDEIESGLNKNHRAKQWRIFRNIAAAVLVFMVCGTVWLRMYNMGSGAQNRQAHVYPTELLEATMYYEGMINDKLEMVKASDHDIDPAIFEDLAAYDQALLELKNDLKDNAGNEEVIAAMIQNYKIKLELLESILQEINAEKDNSQSESKDNEAVSI